MNGTRAAGFLAVAALVGMEAWGPQTIAAAETAPALIKVTVLRVSTGANASRKMATRLQEALRDDPSVARVADVSATPETVAHTPTGDAEAYRQLALKYGAGVLIVTATTDAGPKVNVKVKLYSGATGEFLINDASGPVTPDAAELWLAAEATGPVGEAFGKISGGGSQKLPASAPVAASTPVTAGVPEIEVATVPTPVATPSPVAPPPVASIKATAIASPPPPAPEKSAPVVRMERRVLVNAGLAALLAGAGAYATVQSAASFGRYQSARTNGELEMAAADTRMWDRVAQVSFSLAAVGAALATWRFVHGPDKAGASAALSSSIGPELGMAANGSATIGLLGRF